MLNNSVTSETATSTDSRESATILYGEQLTLWDSLEAAQADGAPTESTQANPVATKPVPVYAVTATVKPLDGSHTLVVVVALLAIEPLAEKWKPP